MIPYISYLGIALKNELFRYTIRLYLAMIKIKRYVYHYFS